MLGNIADDLEGEETSKETSKKRGASDFAARNEDPHNVSCQNFEGISKLVLGRPSDALLSAMYSLLA